MRYGIDCGHNVAFDTGAVGYKNEDVLTKAVGTKVMEYLRQLGNQVTDCTPVTAKSLGDSLYLRTTVASRDNCNFFLSIHFNAGGGHGVEAWCISAKDMAQKLCNEISALGFTNRGIKDGSHLYVVRNTSMPSVLVEVAFVDSQEDMNRVDTVGIDAIAKSIVKALTGNEVHQPTPVENPTYDFKTLQGLIGVEQDNIPGPITLSHCPLVRQGSKGEVVKWMQQRLNCLGFNCGVADGDFGPLTDGAVKRFQNTKGLAADGIVGQNTWRKLLGL